MLCKFKYDNRSVGYYRGAGSRQPVYAVDDGTVSFDSCGGTRPLVGHFDMFANDGDAIVSTRGPLCSGCLVHTDKDPPHFSDYFTYHDERVIDGVRLRPLKKSPKYPNECPCGVAAAQCEYHKKC